MQVYTQTYAAPATWQLNVPGNYFTLFNSTNTVTIRFYKQNKLLNAGEIKNVLAGIEAGPFKDAKADGIAFDRVEIDFSAADTVTCGIGDGSVRYNRSQGSVNVTNSVAVTGGPIIGTNPILLRDAGYVAGANYASQTVIAAGGNSQVFSPAANVNGAFIWGAQAFTANAANNNVSLLAKASAPTTLIDGAMIYQLVQIVTGQPVLGPRLEKARFIPPGLGLYWYSVLLESSAVRYVDYSLL